MTRHTKRIGTWVIAITMLLGIVSCGARHAHHRGMDQDRILKRVTKKLDLNAEQQGLFRQVLVTSEAFRVQMHGQRESMKKPIMQQLMQEALDVSAVNAQFESMEAEFSAFRAKMVNTLAEFHGSLDAAQREKVIKIMEKLSKYHDH
jgi:Spy/CpxP family protein refolding chaperone